ncbi:hypothetical protein [Mucilaginibacter sp. FT3.2]|uniref:hypothetical protein n=1 Tax=Mucilaginibacter sp. FT3.2 TaxID=2723090 RepID=UPI001618CDAA|nr:hypothetical protein [Mucilaginibacter sp. FT3.2]MBB6231279.1 hypothetical protein [Mucilaginibacter sp. FT3.2]
MIKKLTFITLLVIFFSACKNNKQNSGCGLQTCTANFSYLGVRFIDNNGKPVTLKNFSAINLRTNKSLTPVQYPPNIDFVAGFMLLTSDSNIKDFSTGGDNVKVTATDSLTNKTQTATLKISGGCGCHVAKISGPDDVVFN